MILETIITNLTSNLDVLSQQDAKSISSNEKLKDEALKCLVNIIENAPDSEYSNLIHSENHEILLGYLLSITCQLAKNDKSRAIRLQALDLISSITKRLELFHGKQISTQDRCSLTTLILALPGVSSALFKLSMSDTKLPRALLVKCLRTLSTFLAVSYSTCDHCVTSCMVDGTNSKLEGQNLIETCDNLAPRIGYLIDYVTNNCDDLHNEVKCEMLDFCLTIVTKTRVELLTRTLTPVVKYLAFISSTLDTFGSLTKDVQLKSMMLVDAVRVKMQDNSNQGDRLDSMALDCLFKLLDELEENCLTLLISERHAKLAMLCGLLKLLTQDVMMTFLELPDRRKQFLKILSQLVAFSSQQPFLFLTDSRIGPGALERRGENVYTIEKRFLHLTDKEVIYVNTCCQILGNNLEWAFFCDILTSELMQFDSANNLYVTLQVLKGCQERCSGQFKSCRLMKQLTENYSEVIQRSCFEICQNGSDETYSDLILKTVIAIETVAVIVHLHVKFAPNNDRKVIILRDLLCPLLNWCSSRSRAVSEAALNTLSQIGRLYGHESTKSFIEEYIDYIVNGAAQMLDNYLMNPEVTDVLAITFKLSSMNSFYYFKDVFERVFKVLAKYHSTERSYPIVRLLWRTLTTLNDWLDATASGDSNGADDKCPLDTPQGIKSVTESISIDARLMKLRHEMDKNAKLCQMVEAARLTEKEDEREVKRQIESGEVDAEMVDQPEPEDSQVEGEKKVKPDEIVLTERILKHCIGLMSSNHLETKTLAIKAAACGLRIIRNDEDTLLPLVHQIWPPLMSRLTEDYSRNLEVNLCAFECLISMAIYSKDFIRRRTLDAIIPRLCLFLDSQATLSLGKKDYGPYCMTIAYKCQLKVLTHMGQLAYHTEIAYNNLWRIVRVILKYVNEAQVPSLRAAALNSLKYLIALDADCVWYYARQGNQLDLLPFNLVYETS